MTILKFTTSDMLNTTLVDARTGSLAYDIATHLLDGDIDAGTLSRRTWIYDSKGCAVGKITWRGRQPTDITVVDETIGGLTQLFGSSIVRFLPKVLSIPTRFDTEYVWTATRDSLVLLDYDSDETKGQFHYNSLRLGDRFLKSRLPCLGSNYLEFQHHPLAHPVEIIISFIMMEIVRRGRFCLAPYLFPCPKAWRLHDAYDSIIRKMKTIQVEHETTFLLLSLLFHFPRILSTLH